MPNFRTLRSNFPKMPMHSPLTVGVL